MNIHEFLGYFVPVVSVFASYLCGRLQSTHQNTANTARERYEGFYIPYIRTLYKGHVYSGIPIDLVSTESILMEFDLIMNNIQYLGSSSLSCVPQLYDSILNLLEWRDGNESFSSASAICDSEFLEFRKCALLEASELSKALRLPNTAIQLLQHLSAESTAP